MPRRIHGNIPGSLWDPREEKGAGGVLGLRKLRTSWSPSAGDDDDPGDLGGPCGPGGLDGPGGPGRPCQLMVLLIVVVSRRGLRGRRGVPGGPVVPGRDRPGIFGGYTVRFHCSGIHADIMVIGTIASTLDS